MPSKRQCLGWGIYIAALIAIGVALELSMPPWPRFVLHDPHLSFLAGEADLCADGKVLLTGILGDRHEDGWVCDARRSWDTVSGRERGKVFANLVVGDPAALAGHELFFSPGRRYVALVHPTGLAVADLIAEKEWLNVLSWKDARQGPRQFSPLYQYLAQPISVEGLQEKRKLKDVLELFTDRTMGNMPILVNKDAFERKTIEDVYEEEVSLPPVPKRMPIKTALRIILPQVAKGGAIFIVRRHHVEITTREHEGEDQVREPIFSARGSFIAVAEGLTNAHRLHIIESATGQRLATFAIHQQEFPQFGFTPNEELLYFLADDNGQPLFTVWSTKTKQIVRTIDEIGLGCGSDGFQLSPDGKSVLVDCDPDGATVDLFDLRTGEKRQCFEACKPGEAADHRPRYLFSPDGRTLVRIGSDLKIWDVPNGRMRAVINFDGDETIVQGLFISADSKAIASPHWEQWYGAWSLETGKVLWPENLGGAEFAKPYGRLRPDPPRVTPDHRYLVAIADGRIDFRAPATSELRSSVIMGDDFGQPGDIRFTRDGRWMLSVWSLKQARPRSLIQKWLGKWWPFQDPTGYVLVTEVATGRTVFRLGDTGPAYELSDDGGTLMSFAGPNGDQPAEICCYDVPGRPSRWLVVGVPLSLFLAGLLRRWWSCRRKPAKQSTAAM